MSASIYSNAALADLAEIWEFVANDSPFQADRLIRHFQTKLDHLAKWNTLGRARPELNCRCFPVGKYSIYYRPTNDGIQLVRLLHSARDIRQIKLPE